MGHRESAVQAGARETTSDELFDALSDGHRRRILTELLADAPGTGPEVSTDAFIDGEADEEGDEAARIMQRHTHLPNLENKEFIQWNRGADTVERGPCFEAIKPALERLGANSGELPVNWV